MACLPSASATPHPRVGLTAYARRVLNADVPQKLPAAAPPAPQAIEVPWLSRRHDSSALPRQLARSKAGPGAVATRAWTEWDRCAALPCTRPSDTQLAVPASVIPCSSDTSWGPSASLRRTSSVSCGVGVRRMTLGSHASKLVAAWTAGSTSLCRTSLGSPSAKGPPPFEPPTRSRLSLPSGISSQRERSQ